LITQTRAKQAATMSEVEWRGRTVPVKIDKVRIFLLGLADNEAAIAQVRSWACSDLLVCLPVVLVCWRYDILLLIRIWVTISRCMLLSRTLLKAEFIEEFSCVEAKEIDSDSLRWKWEWQRAASSQGWHLAQQVVQQRGCRSCVSLTSHPHLPALKGHLLSLGPWKTAWLNPICLFYVWYLCSIHAELYCPMLLLT